MIKFRIKKGDTVKVLSGKDKGKTGKILSVHRDSMRVVVENVNLHTRFEKAKKAGEKGKKVEFPASMAISNVQLIDPHAGKPTRVGYVFLEEGKKQRIGKVSGKNI